MTGLDRIQGLLSRITYKPWAHINFTVSEPSDYPFLKLYVSIKVPDKALVDLKVVTAVTRVATIVPEYTDERIIDIVLSMICDLETHEVKEWLEFDRKPIREPHPELTSAIKDPVHL